MANGRNKLRKGDAGRDSGGFVALPWAVLDCPAYGRLSMHARALLLEVARQFVRDNNGMLLLSRAYMGARGWKSCDMLDKCKRELLDAGFIFETVKGQRPNKAGRYAVTWRNLDRHPGYDAGAVEGFKRGAYRQFDPVTVALSVPPHGPAKNASLYPPGGTMKPSIGPPHGTEQPATVPPHGAMRATFTPLSVPPHGHHLEKPSTGSEAKEPRALNCTAQNTATSSKTSGRPTTQNAVADEPAWQSTTVKRLARKTAPPEGPAAQLALL